jgi:hypothetical protein
VEINDGEATNGKDEINPGFLQRSETCIKWKIMKQQY